MTTTLRTARLIKQGTLTPKPVIVKSKEAILNAILSLRREVAAKRVATQNANQTAQSRFRSLFKIT